MNETLFVIFGFVGSIEELDEPLSHCDARLDLLFRVENGSACDAEGGVIVLGTAEGGAASDTESGNIALGEEILEDCTS